ncbi:hypothetical protein C7999DRAFT_28369 [Corynascus novoguineensis]|uniref:FAD-binding FR-type domain-containing protein n=1 Tax=Corynascus novoguineensis TaxID=1126955 RepID=A0AAN7CZ61_9PEZI|nr:hypothetical protein C7999DRAFT_28369 [Corynascus novoguineensis]
MKKQSHIERTAHEPRDASLHTLTISRIIQASPTVRIFHLTTPQNNSITFLPGQWVDLYPPPEAGIPKPGGFTITSSPSLALPKHKQTQTAHAPVKKEVERNDQEKESPYIELAIQSSPQNPVAAYLFLPSSQLLHTPVRVRIGGSFVFPPPPALLAPSSFLRKVVLVAGGMGINPLMSMLSWIGEQASLAAAAGGNGDSWGEVEVEVLYSVRNPRHQEEKSSGAGSGSGILFLERIERLFRGGTVKGRLRLFLTEATSVDGGAEEAEERGVVSCEGGVGEVPFLRRRMTVDDVIEAVGKDKDGTVIYVCGVPSMTDEFVEALVSPEGYGMDKKRVLFEKWW